MRNSQNKFSSKNKCCFKVFAFRLVFTQRIKTVVGIVCMTAIYIFPYKIYNYVNQSCSVILKIEQFFTCLMGKFIWRCLKSVRVCIDNVMRMLCMIKPEL